MRFRQVHLDFHTSEKIEGIGARFDKKQFQDALRRGHVDSITVFSKCHHGWAYHPSEKNEMHPHLSFDLLGAQIEAAHEIGVKTPVYLSAGFDEKLAPQHPEWLVRSTPTATTDPAELFARPGYHLFCLNTPYLDILLDQITEVLERYDADGIFLDIMAVRRCYCKSCMETMQAEGLNPDDPRDVDTMGERVYATYTRRVRETVDRLRPGLPVFHNGGHIRRGRRDLAYADTHLELESLPTGGWGYDHFPMSAAYSRTLGMEYLGMTGKFHLSWGEFGGFKHPNALRYEAALSAAFGAKCSVGDQLHPNGYMDPATYDLIGAAYSELEAKEPWLDHVRAVADIAILSQEAVANYYAELEANRDATRGDVGAVRVLLEGHYLFDVVDTQAPLDGYKLVILPDTVRLDGALTEKLQAFVNAGGKILATGTSGLKKDEDAFAFDLGAVYKGKCAFNPTYVRPDFDPAPLLSAAYVIYAQTEDIDAAGEILAHKEDPYFNRTAEHFCSHQHAPNNPAAVSPAITVGKNGAYAAAALFTEYANCGSIIAKLLLHRVIDALIGDSKTVETDLPAQGVTTLMEQPAENRLVHHLLYASPVRRGQKTEIIEDILPVYDIHVSLRTDKAPKRVYLAPANTDLPFTYDDGTVHYTLPKLYIHQMIVLEF